MGGTNQRKVLSASTLAPCTAKEQENQMKREQKSVYFDPEAIRILVVMKKKTGKSAT